MANGPELPEKTRPEDREEDVEGAEPASREGRPGKEDDVGEVPARRGADQTSDIERDGGPPPGREGHDREMQERRPHRDEPI